jgi:hypothetical protein
LALVFFAAVLLLRFAAPFEAVLVEAMSSPGAGRTRAPPVERGDLDDARRRRGGVERSAPGNPTARRIINACRCSARLP